jgi:murein DD-endopeptidase MepM/ murein hydrolase activator NlpD
MASHLPRRLRVVISADENGRPRQVVLGRGVLIGALVVVVGIVAAVVVMLAVYSRAVAKGRHADAMVARLQASEEQLTKAQELRQELEQMREIQERLLGMLGVDQDAAAAAGAAAGLPRAPGPLRQAAAGVVTPPPDRWPVSGYVTQEFGKAGRSRDHSGMDIAQPAGTPIVAAGDGHIARTGQDKFLGAFVEIQHGLGYLTVYGHCSKVVLPAGTVVRAGQVIGYTGQTGEAAAPHLHFEVWRDGEPVDPRQVLRGDPPAS